MTMQTALFVLLIVGGTALLSWPVGRYITRVMDPEGEGGFTRLFRAIGGRPAQQAQDWKRYVLAMLVFNALMFTVVALIQALQQILPLNPDQMGAVSPATIFNTAISFTTNTNLQHYSGESTYSYLTQLFGLMWLQFVSAGTGIAALVALARGLSGRPMGNFFVDLQRAAFLVLLPLAFIAALLLAIGGLPMTFDGSAVATTLEGATQNIARGPVAAFVAIKQLGSNGGGFFGPNSTHPFENATMLSNMIELVLIILLPMACVWMFARIVKRVRHGFVIFAVMGAFLVAMLGVSLQAESYPTAAFQDLPILNEGGNMEGKELRLGAATGPLWAVLTTATSNGSVGAMHDSLNPITGLMPMIGMWLSETFGGVGVGMVNMFLYIIVAVFVAGMMIGRTPEYLWWRVEAREMRLALFSLLAHGAAILGFTALFAATPWGTDTLNNSGPHGFSEILYEFSSSAANNGSGFEGLGDGTTPWNIATAIVMLFMRFLPIILPLAIVGSLMQKRRATESVGTLSVESGVFATMLAVTVIVVGALTFFSAATLGPVAEHLAIN